MHCYPPPRERGRRAVSAKPVVAVWTRRDSNPRATGYEPAALTAELQVRDHRNPRGGGRQLRMLTPRAATRSSVMADAPDWISMSTLAVRLSGIASVGLNAIEFVYET